MEQVIDITFNPGVERCRFLIESVWKSGGTFYVQSKLLLPEEIKKSAHDWMFDSFSCEVDVEHKVEHFLIISPASPEFVNQTFAGYEPTIITDESQLPECVQSGKAALVQKCTLESSSLRSDGAETSSDSDSEASSEVLEAPEYEIGSDESESSSERESSSADEEEEVYVAPAPVAVQAKSAYSPAFFAAGLAVAGIATSAAVAYLKRPQ